MSGPDRRRMMEEERRSVLEAGGGDGPPPELYTSPRWYACRTCSRAEKAVARRLAGSGLEAYLPLLRQKRQWADRVKRVELPLFPGYVFARFDLTRLHEVIVTPGVATVVRANGHPTPVREAELESVRALVAGANETGVQPAAAPDLEPGREVVVADGPFQGVRGTLVEERGAHRVVVRLAAVRQAVAIEIDRRLLRAVNV